MDLFIQASPLRDLYEKVAAGKRISEAEALRMFESRELHVLGAMGNLACQRWNGRRASYILNCHINYSNYCVLNCRFCAYAQRTQDRQGFRLTVAQIVEKAQAALALGVTELHIVGGLDPELPFNYYLEMLQALRRLEAGLHLKCFTAIEVIHLAAWAKMSIRDTLGELRKAGLDSLTGGGAEIFRPAVRRRIARGKETAEEWVEVHRTWHELGGHSTCTMLYGHVESPADRVDHLRRLRELQDLTGGFTSFVALPFQPSNNRLGLKHPPSGFDTLRTIAVSRVYLDNFRHLTAYWVGLGLKLAQVALSFGADDLHGTVLEEHVFHTAGATSSRRQTESDLVRTIREAGRVPVRRDSLYRPLKVWDSAALPAEDSDRRRSEMLERNLATA
jgi:aminodeoxyfutalosine synthase